MRVANLRTVADVRRAANRRMPRMVADFIDGGAEDEGTVVANRRGFGDVALQPAALAGRATRDLRTTVCGQEVALPVLLSPAGLLRLAHADDGRLEEQRAEQLVDDHLRRDARRERRPPRELRRDARREAERHARLRR